MALFNHATKEVTAKLVYYGPGLCGKTTNLQWIHDNLSFENKGKLVSLATQTDRTLFFDFLPVELGTIRGMRTRMQIYTVPGQVFYEATRRMVLKGCDAVVFVADSQAAMLDANFESLQSLRRNLLANEIDPAIPMVIQYNKRDLPTALPVSVLNERLNPRKLSYFEAIAFKGDGVEETLRGITKALFRWLSEYYAESGRAMARPSSGATAPPAPKPRAQPGPQGGRVTVRLPETTQRFKPPAGTATPGPAGKMTTPSATGDAPPQGARPTTTPPQPRQPTPPPSPPTPRPAPARPSAPQPASTARATTTPPSPKPREPSLPPPASTGPATTPQPAPAPPKAPESRPVATPPKPTTPQPAPATPKAPEPRPPVAAPKPITTPQAPAPPRAPEPRPPVTSPGPIPPPEPPGRSEPRTVEPTETVVFAESPEPEPLEVAAEDLGIEELIEGIAEAPDDEDLAPTIRLNRPMAAARPSAPKPTAPAESPAAAPAKPTPPKAPPEDPPPQGAGLTEDQWLYLLDGSQRGPIDIEDLVDLVLTSISEDTKVWHPGLEGWVMAHEVPEIAQEIPPPLPVPGAARGAVIEEDMPDFDTVPPQFRTALIADEDEAFRRYLAMPLAAQGFTILEAADGSAAWQLAVQHRPWLILADVSMPEVDGFEFCRRVRSHPLLSHTPLLFISGSDKYKERYHALQIGADDFLTKQTKIREILMRIQLLLTKYSDLSDQAQEKKKEGEKEGAFEGRIEVFGAPALLQMCAQGRLTGLFTALAEDDSSTAATMGFRSGEIVSATVGANSGLGAAYAFLTWDKGSFQFTPGDPGEGEPLAQSVEHLLLEGCRLLDESQRDSGGTSPF